MHLQRVVTHTAADIRTYIHTNMIDHSTRTRWRQL